MYMLIYVICTLSLPVRRPFHQPMWEMAEVIAMMLRDAKLPANKKVSTFVGVQYCNFKVQYLL